MRKDIIKTWAKIILVIVFLYLFLTSIGLMGKAFKGFGRGFAENLLNTTSNPFIGLFIGILATSLVQSSSTTTSIVVGMVASGIIPIGSAIPVVMGANIGTTTTAILASFATGNISAITIAFVHFLFNVIGVCFVYPIKTFRKISINLAKNLGELAFKRRRYVLIYVLGVFFIIPAILILVSKKERKR